MKKHLLTFLLGIFLLQTLACEGGSKPYNGGSYAQGDDFEIEERFYEDGTYCAELKYHNPSTGTKSTYYLNVLVEYGGLTVIYWPNGGQLDSTHFIPQDITSGKCSFVTEKGLQYTVTLEDIGGCKY